MVFNCLERTLKRSLCMSWHPVEIFSYRNGHSYPWDRSTREYTRYTIEDSAGNFPGKFHQPRTQLADWAPQTQLIGLRALAHLPAPRCTGELGRFEGFSKGSPIGFSKSPIYWVDNNLGFIIDIAERIII